jgi:ribosomal protein S2/predicted RNA-binding protein with TRAM domain
MTLQNKTRETTEVSGYATKKTLNKSKIKVGDICILKISALGPQNIGIDEYSYSYSIFVPNAKLGETVKVKIVKTNLKEDKYIIGEVLDTIKKEKVSLLDNLSIQPDEILTINIEKLTSKGTGIIDLKNNYKLIIPNAKIGTNLEVIVTRLKSKYGFAKLVIPSNFQTTEKEALFPSSNKLVFVPKKQQTSKSLSNTKKTISNSVAASLLLEGSKYSLVLPKKANYYGKYAIVKLQGSVLFIKLALGAKVGTKVRIKITKVNEKFAVAKIIQINPTSLLKKRSLIQNSIREMVKNGLHLGEQAVKCNARMKNYIWFKSQKTVCRRNEEGLPLRGVRWDDKKVKQHLKNRPLIKKGRHIINLLKTRRCLNKALTQLSKYALKGRTFLFIGTKKPAAGLVARASLFSKNSFFVNTRWLGGMLTNWKTILKSISKIRPILKEKQKIIGDILEKRQAIKIGLIKKALLLKKKSKLILNKGRLLIEQFKNASLRNSVLEKTKTLALKGTQLLENSYSLFAKRKVLNIKRRELMYQSIILKEKGLQVISRYKNLLNQLVIYIKKLRELKYLLILSNEIKNIKNQGREQNKEILNISYGKIKELTINSSNFVTQYNVIPNPPKDILNLILLVMKNKYETDITNSATKSITTNNKVLVLSKLVSKFSRFSPYLQDLIKTYEQNIKEIQNSLKSSSVILRKIKTTLVSYVQLKNSLVEELNGIKIKLISERNILRLVKTKLKQFVVQKKLIQFLPRLRYLATPLFTNKINETVKILMKKIVDPKLKYPIDNIYEDKLSNNSKKVITARKKKWQRLEKYFGGIANMTKMSKSQISKNIAIIIGQKEEINAVRECQKLGIKMFNIVDTNCNPSFADHIIPANDDSRNSIKYVLNKFLVRIRLAQKLRKKMSQKIFKKNDQKNFNQNLKNPKIFKKMNTVN